MTSLNKSKKKIEENKNNLKSFIPNQFQKKYDQMTHDIKILFEK